MAIFLESIFVLSAMGKWVTILHYWTGYGHGAAAILHHSLQVRPHGKAACLF